MSSHYNSDPNGPLSREDAVMALVTDKRYELTLREAEDLVGRSESSVTGMASCNRHGIGRTIWVSQLATQGGKFMIELE
jgi:hypothetical protein